MNTENHGQTIAKCYIYKEGDNRNLCLLTSQSLHIHHKGRKYSFLHDSIGQIMFKHKQLLFPIVFGGIISSLAAVGLMAGYLSTLILLPILMGGLLWLYHGVEGSDTLTIITKIKEYDFFIRKISPNLKAFVAFANRYQPDEEVIYYAHVSKLRWQQAMDNGKLKATPPLQLTYHPVAPDTDHIQLVVNALQLSGTITYRKGADLNLYPVLADDIPVGELQVLNSMNQFRQGS